jgi:1,4-dihydroxy-2-naphthoyl-CoA hydrolase
VTDATTPRVDTSQGVHGALGIEMVELTKERVIMRTPVTSRVHQPHGLLHGGVSALIAESAASIGGMQHVGPGQAVVGIELNASHLRGMSSGTLTATARPLRVGRRVQVWTIDLTDDDGRLICAARCSLAVIEIPEGA